MFFFFPVSAVGQLCGLSSPRDVLGALITTVLGQELPSLVSSVQCPAWRGLGALLW